MKPGPEKTPGSMMPGGSPEILLTDWKFTENIRHCQYNNLILKAILEFQSICKLNVNDRVKRKA